jgi:hypothetical protein
MSNKTLGDAYVEAATVINGAYQRFQYGFGGQIEVLMTLLEKQHYQAAADIMPLIQREKVGFEAILLEAHSSFLNRAEHLRIVAMSEEAAEIPPVGQPEPGALEAAG